MALTLDKSTFGYDASELPALINEIRVNCIEAAEKTMNAGLAGIEAAVDDSWVGASADKYKEKFREDVQTTISKLHDIGDQVEAELKNAGQGMVDIDESINF